MGCSSGQRLNTEKRIMHTSGGTAPGERAGVGHWYRIRSVRRHLPLLLALLLTPMLVAWPLPRVWSKAMLTVPGRDASGHVWALWAALQEGSPYLGHTDLLGYPDGFFLTLLDSANLPFFALGSWTGPAAGYNTALWGGLLVSGVAGAMLARRLGGSAWLGAVLAMAAPPMLAASAEGTTGSFCAGWVLLQLALLLRFLDTGRVRDGVLAALALAMAWHGGPYNGFWAAGLDLTVALWIVARGWSADPSAPRRRHPALGRAVLVGGGALLLCLPLAWAMLGVQDPGMPGSVNRGSLPPAFESPAAFRGGLQHGADLLDPWLPLPLTGGEAEVSHTAYVGIVALVVAVIAVVRDRKRWPWLAGSLAFSLLSLGPALYLHGRELTVGGEALLGPANLLIRACPPLGRLAHWYRAGAVAALLLVPLVASQGRGWRGPVLAALVLADLLLAAPLAWPLPQGVPPSSGALRQLESGALVELPLQAGPPLRLWDWRYRNVLGQVDHGHPITGAMMDYPLGKEAQQAYMAVHHVASGNILPDGRREALLDRGFRWVVLYPELLGRRQQAAAALERCFGAPVVEESQLRVFDLSQRGPGCAAPAPPR